MKIFKRTYLPEYINYNGKKYIYDAKNSALINQIISLDLGNCICIEVLHRNLKGKLDFHNKPYKPTKHIFSKVL